MSQAGFFLPPMAVGRLGRLTDGEGEEEEAGAVIGLALNLTAGESDIAAGGFAEGAAGGLIADLPLADGLNAKAAS